jgi:hypothetical protein
MAELRQQEPCLALQLVSFTHAHKSLTTFACHLSTKLHWQTPCFVWYIMDICLGEGDSLFLLWEEIVNIHY